LQFGDFATPSTSNPYPENTENTNIERIEPAQKDIDKAFLHTDDDDFFRWEIPNEYFERDFEPDSQVYIDKVNHFLETITALSFHCTFVSWLEFSKCFVFS